MTDEQVARALAGARPVSFWLDQDGAPASLPPLTGRISADLAVIGGGFTGLWTALLAKEADSGRDVVLVEGRPGRRRRHRPERRVLRCQPYPRAGQWPGQVPC